MEENPSRPNLKRPFSEDDDGDTSTKPPMQKKVRFPKGKKVRQEDEALVGGRADNQPPSQSANPLLAAKERALHRSQITTELLIDESRAIGTDVSFAEVAYEENENFVEDGIQIEPFNLDKEREEGYFDADGNFVEYVNDKEIKDAWLDSVDIAPKYAGKTSALVKNYDDVQELSSKDIAKMKRRIADVLEPGETVLQALRRLKGTSNSRKEKMSAETKLVFDQLTEDAMKLMENDVYHESREVFDREAEGYEKLLRARGESTSISAGQGYSIAGEDIFSSGTDTGIVALESAKPSTVDEFDIFAEDDENTTNNPSSNGDNMVSRPYTDGVGQPISNTPDTHTDSGALQSDYVFDESSGYYYSSSSGYYYDPSTGLYCSAVSGKWLVDPDLLINKTHTVWQKRRLMHQLHQGGGPRHTESSGGVCLGQIFKTVYSFNEETSTYDEIPTDASTVN